MPFDQTRADRDLPQRPYLARYKYVFPKHRFFEWQEKDEWLARYMGVGREVLVRFESKSANSGAHEVLMISQPGKRPDEIRVLPNGIAGYGRPFEYLVHEPSFAIDRVDGRDRYKDAFQARRESLHPQFLVFGDSRVIAYAPREMNRKRLLLSAVALLEELGFKMVVPASKYEPQMILPVEHFL